MAAPRVPGMHFAAITVNAFISIVGVPKSNGRSRVASRDYEMSPRPHTNTLTRNTVKWSVHITR